MCICRPCLKIILQKCVKQEEHSMVRFEGVNCIIGASLSEPHIDDTSGHLQYCIPYCLAVTPCSLLRPPPPPLYFRANYCIGLFYLHYTPPPPPPRATRACLWYCSSYTCTRVASVEELYSCIKCVENSLRTGLGLFH